MSMAINAHCCVWCVQRNYRFFLLFVFTTAALDLYVDGWCWGHLAKLASHNVDGWWGAIHQGVSGPAALALIIYTLLALGWVPCRPPAVAHTTESALLASFLFFWELVV